jgi:hypothetical protein
MPYLTKYHLREQEAYALLGPVRAALRELERRTAHYAGRVPLEPPDAAAVLAAQRVLEDARREVERIWLASAPGPEPGVEPEAAGGAEPEAAR